mmetsp:Transcript_42925/g.108368  ORF Transcript_42925/g.108368 Transcript_42925/m.108368 type:complete len:320 (-) Transcript_42925:816-1775(-)
MSGETEGEQSGTAQVNVFRVLEEAHEGAHVFAEHSIDGVRFLQDHVLQRGDHLNWRSVQMRDDLRYQALRVCGGQSTQALGGHVTSALIVGAGSTLCEERLEQHIQVRNQHVGLGVQCADQLVQTVQQQVAVGRLFGERVHDLGDEQLWCAHCRSTERLVAGHLHLLRLAHLERGEQRTHHLRVTAHVRATTNLSEAQERLHHRGRIAQRRPARRLALLLALAAATALAAAATALGGLALRARGAEHLLHQHAGDALTVLLGAAHDDGRRAAGDRVQHLLAGGAGGRSSARPGVHSRRQRGAVPCIAGVDRTDQLQEIV